MRVTVRVDASGVRRALSGLRESVSDRAILRALNRAVDAGKTEAVKLTREELSLKAADVRKAIKVRKSGASLSRAEIVIEPKPVPIIDYGARPTRRGVSVKIKRGGARKIVRHAFFATMASGHKGVFKRVPGTIGPRSRREKIKEVFSTSVGQLFKRRSAVERVVQRVSTEFLRRAQHEIRQALRRGRASG